MIYKYEVRISDQSGNDIGQQTNFTSIKLSRAVNDIGTLELIVPSWDTFDLFKPDARISISRSINNGPLKLVGDTVWIVTGRKKIRKNRSKSLVIYAKDSNLLLDRHIVAYSAGTSQAQQTTYADDLMKSLVSQNLGSSATDTTRAITGLTVASNNSLAPSLSKAFSYRNVLTVLQELSQASYQTGTYLAFDIYCASANSFDFRTYPNVRGIDKRYSTAALPLVINSDINIGDMEYFEDYEKNANAVYAGGQGEQSNRLIVTQIDSTRNYSNIGRIERFVDARNANTSALVSSEASTALRNNRPKTSFVGTLIQTDNLLFGRDINFGDYVSVQVDVKTIVDCRIDAFGIQLGADGKEVVTIVFRSDL